MKVRTGYVSNSSSSSFILNMKDEEVSEIVKELKIKGVPVIASMPSLGRYSAIMHKEGAKGFAEELAEWNDEWDDEDKYAMIIKKYIDKLGDDFVLVRLSDECDLYSYKTDEKLKSIALDYREYH